MAHKDERITVRYHKAVANWTRVLAIFTILLAVTSSAQWYLMLEANRDNHEAFLETQRPWLAGANEGLGYYDSWTGSGDVPDGYKIGFHLYNSGNSTAIMKKFTIATCMTPCTSAENHDIAPTATSMSGVVGAKSRVIPNVVISKNDLIAVANGSKKMAIMLYVEYTDTMSTGRTYHLVLCDKLLVRRGFNPAVAPPHDATFDQLFEYTICDSNNMSD